MSTISAKRCILNVSTSRYVPFQKRLVKSLADQRWTGRVVTWAGRLPTDSPPHEDAPYAFKLYAVAEATKMGFTSILWLDSTCVATRRLEPIFESIERYGHCFVSSDERLGNWASDACLDAFGLDRDRAMGLALLNGAFIGLDLEHARTREWFRSALQQCKAGLFKGAALTEHAPADVRTRNHDKDTGHLSDDPRCWGHRHDEAVGSCLAHALGMDFMRVGAYFDFGAHSKAIVRLVED